MMGLKRRGNAAAEREPAPEDRALPPDIQPGLKEGCCDAVCTSYVCVFGRSFLIPVLTLDSPEFSTVALSHEITGNSRPLRDIWTAIQWIEFLL